MCHCLCLFVLCNWLFGCVSLRACLVVCVCVRVFVCLAVSSVCLFVCLFVCLCVFVSFVFLLHDCGFDCLIVRMFGCSLFRLNVCLCVCVCVFVFVFVCLIGWVRLRV